jgi:predicted short-subunit dehydrogenase-like oxidoreductase (DUF2520 family)
LHPHPQRAFALVGPGRAGTAIAAALVARGWDAVAVAGRDVAAETVRAAARQLGAEARDVGGVGHGAALVVVATPDAAIAEAASGLAAGLDAHALVVHLSGACTIHELDKLAVARPDVRVGSLHPLQSLPSGALGASRLPGSWCAVDGDPQVERIAVSLGMRPFRVAPARRATYHAAAAVASNHLVALLGQAWRIAADAGIPPEALLPLVRATVDNVETLGPRAALTGPVARGDVDTVARHLAALQPDERLAYCALADAALRLTGHDDPALADVLREGRS